MKLVILLQFAISFATRTNSDRSEDHIITHRITYKIHGQFA